MPITEVSAKDAFDFLQKEKNSALVDVRTFEEFNFVGAVNPVDFDNRMVFVPWKMTMAMKDNPSFAEDLEGMLKRLFSSKTKDTKLLFLCRSGARSRAAAQFANSLGYTTCFNILDGFEGDPNEKGQRGTVSGWKAEGLPWKQS